MEKKLQYAEEDKQEQEKDKEKQRKYSQEQLEKEEVIFLHIQGWDELVAAEYIEVVVVVVVARPKGTGNNRDAKSKQNSYFVVVSKGAQNVTQGFGHNREQRRAVRWRW